METLSPQLNLTLDELRLVEVLFEAILPADKATGCPGARAVGAVDCLQRVLAMDESKLADAPRWRALYRAGLAALERVAREREGASLASLGTDAVTRLLQELSGGKLAPMPSELDQKGFFNLLRDHCIQGCFSDPRWGGNHEAAMWKWFGYLHEVS